MASAKSGTSSRSRESKKLVLLILPFLVLVFLFCYLPLYGWIYAFYDYRAPLKLSQCEFVGFKWFIKLFSNPTQVRQLLFAVFLNEIRCKWFKNLVQTVTTVPNFISWTLVYAVAFALFSTNGMVNSFLKSVGAIDTAIKFLDSGKHVWLSMILWSIWKNLGWDVIMYLAALSGIDAELFDAASVDGAGRFQMMRYITIPSLLPTFFVLIMLKVANFLTNGMDQYYVFQNAFNKESIQVLDLYVYNIGMMGKSLSLATAVGVLKSIVSVTLLFLVNTTSKKVRGESIV